MTTDEKLKVIARGISMLLIGTGPLTFEWVVSRGEDPREAMKTYDKILKELEEAAANDSPRVSQ